MLLPSSSLFSDRVFSSFTLPEREIIPFISMFSEEVGLASFGMSRTTSGLFVSMTTVARFTVCEFPTPASSVTIATMEVDPSGESAKNLSALISAFQLQFLSPVFAATFASSGEVISIFPYSLFLTVISFSPFLMTTLRKPASASEAVPVIVIVFVAEPAFLFV